MEATEHTKPVTSDVTYFAMTDVRGKNTAFGIKAKDRLRHMYVIGKTGMGKSTMLENLAIQDIQNGEGMCFIDPHGSAIETLLEFIPQHRIKDVVYFAPHDTEYPVGFNILEDPGKGRHLVVAGLMSSFKRIWKDAWSSRMEYILENTLLALLEYPDATLVDVNRMLTNKEFRNKVLDRVTDPIVLEYWRVEVKGYTDRFWAEATPAIQNKIGQFVSNPLVRNIIAQPKSTFNVREIMDSKKIFLVNLSKGRIGEQNAELLGSMLVTKIFLSAMSRAEESKSVLEQLPTFYLYVDEFQNVASDSFANILSEARKYKLALIIAHQYIEQLEEEIRNAVFGNVGTTITFRVGPYDADALETMFKPTFTADDLVNLGFAQIYLTLMIDGIGSAPFSARTIGPVNVPDVTFVTEVQEASRAQYGTARAEVEALIDAGGMTPARQGKKTKKKKKQQKDTQTVQKNTEQAKKQPPQLSQSKQAQFQNPAPQLSQAEKKQPESKQHESKKAPKKQKQNTSNTASKISDTKQKQALAEAIKQVEKSTHTSKQSEISPQDLRAVLD